MSQIPSELRYTATHEWIRIEDNGDILVGVTDHAQQLLGDLVYVELPELEQNVKMGEEIGVVESVKAASDIYAPISGEVSAINEELADSPEHVNEDPYGHGWLFKITPDDEHELHELLDADGYEDLIESDS